MASTSRVRVVVRVRPAQLQDENERVWVQCIDSSTLHTLNHRNSGQTLAYDFQTVFNPESTQKAVYQGCVESLLIHLFDGQNASVFAYGPTGAGKTHTILGTPSDPGIIPRCVRDICEIRKRKLCPSSCIKKPLNIDLSFSYLEIYQEKVHDLLNPSTAPDLPIREDMEKNIFVAGLCEKGIQNVEEFNSLFGPASKNRSTAATKLNSRSSRSHSVLILKVKVTYPGRTLTGKLHIIDLAGSEDNRRTGNQGERLRESGAINTSLLALSQVVDALNRNQPRIPYRGSKLTRLLQDSLGGNAHSCMIVNLAPEERFYYDTYVTLNFARKTKKIVNTVKVNEVKDKEVAVVKPMPKKRPASDSAPNSSNDSHSSCEATPPKKPAPPALFLSPLIRNQVHFEQEMVNRLENFESRIIEQVKTQLLQNPTQLSSELRSVLTKLNLSPEEISGPPSESTDKPPSGNAKPSEKVKPNIKVFRDGSTMDKFLQEVTNSPLFKVRSKAKGKAFKSSAAPVKGLEGSSSAPEGTSEAQSMELQQKHNERILGILNSGKVAEIKKLQTIGGKKADVVVQWTSLNGPLLSFEDLRKAGFSAANLRTFLGKNLIQL